MVGVGQNLQIHRKIISKQVFGSSKSFLKEIKKCFLALIHFSKVPQALFSFGGGRELALHAKVPKKCLGKLGFVFLFVCF